MCGLTCVKFLDPFVDFFNQAYELIERRLMPLPALKMGRAISYVAPGATIADPLLSSCQGPPCPNAPGANLNLTHQDFYSIGRRNLPHLKVSSCHTRLIRTIIDI
jgi:hypothetical protein